jgi:Flp pilus assembly pilin Flp
VRDLARDDHGASSVEYGLIVFAIAAAIVIAVVAFGDVVTGTFTTSCDTFQSTRTAYDSSVTASC